MKAKAFLDTFFSLYIIKPSWVVDSQGVNVHITFSLLFLLIMLRGRGMILLRWVLEDSPSTIDYCTGLFALGSEVNSLLVPFFNLGRGIIHPIDLTSEIGRDTGREITNERVVVGDTTEGDVVLELRDVIGKRMVFGDLGGGKPGDGFVLSVSVYKGLILLFEKIGECSKALRTSF